MVRTAGIIAPIGLGGTNAWWYGPRSRLGTPSDRLIASPDTAIKGPSASPSAISTMR